LMTNAKCVVKTMAMRMSSITPNVNNKRSIMETHEKIVKIINNNSPELAVDEILRLFGVSESYSILITDIPNFRKELITMIEQVRYQTGRYSEGSSTEIAERFERTVNSR